MHLMDRTSYLKVLGAQALAAFDRIWAQKIQFFGTFFLVVLISYGILYAVDFIPEAPTEEAPTVVVRSTPLATTTPQTETTPSRDVAPYPNRITIEKIDLDAQVLNPEGDSIAELDAALLEGAVRHPDSADFKNTGTMLVFGHSSYLPTVNNRNFQAFNGIQKLVWGDEIVVLSRDRAYTYRVERVYKAAASETEVELDHSEPRLILVTCNSFGSKDDRFVVEAVLMAEQPL